MLQNVLGAAASLASLLWITVFVQALRHRRRLKRLAGQPPEPPPPAGWPPVAILFAARDEEEHVGPAARTLLAQDYPAFEIIAIDDRSRDRTGPILDEIATADPRLRVVHVHDLPPGWLGKTHALQSGANLATASWLLLTDADVYHAPDTLRRALRYALETGADHLVVTPDNHTQTEGERLFLAMFLAVFAVASPTWAVEHMQMPNHLGIGAFNLVRADAFHAIGGFRNLALSVDDDMRLGQALKAAGYQPRVLLGDGCVGLRWQVGLAGMIRGLEKNFFAAMNFRTALLPLAALVILATGALPAVGLLAGPPATRASCLAGVLSLAALVDLAGRSSRVRWWHGLLMPLSAILLLVALLRSAALTLRRGGVRWRDHLYPLPQLRAHVRRRDRWLRELWRSTR